MTLSVRAQPRNFIKKDAAPGLGPPDNEPTFKFYLYFKRWNQQQYINIHPLFLEFKPKEKM